MKLVYGITVSTEEKEVLRLIKYLKDNTKNDIVVQYDESKDNSDLIDKIKKFDVTLTSYVFDGDFSNFKNNLNLTCEETCKADYIFQLDADEMISDYLVNNIDSIIEENPQVELFYLPRINTVEGITMEHINKWKWNLDKQGRINFPDYQGRIYKSNLQWSGNVHERIVGVKNYSLFPLEEEFCIIHNKTIKKQEEQNELYSSL